MKFDLQRFTDEGKTISDAQAESAPETQTEEPQSLPEELGGLPEEYARETYDKWIEMQSAAEIDEQTKSQPAQTAQPAEEQSITREQYQAALDEANKLKAQLAEYQRQQAPPQQQPQQQQQPPQQYQPQPLKFTPEVTAQINDAITAEAMQLTGFSKDDVASLEFADDDDPRLPQWNQAKNFATARVYGAIQQMQLAQQTQAQQFLDNHRAAVNTYNEFAQKEIAEPDFKDIQQFATGEFFEQLSPFEQKTIANSYVRVERQTASPAELLIIKNYFEKAKAAYRARKGKAKTAPRTQPAQQAANLPRSDQLKGTSTLNDGLSVSDMEKLLLGDFTQLTPQQQNAMLGLTG